MSTLRERFDKLEPRERRLLTALLGILGAFVLTGLSEGLTELLHALGFDIPGAKQVFYGVCLLVVITALPEGIWPWLARRLRLEKRP